MYSAIRPLLFLFDPELTHHLSLNSLALLDRCRCLKLLAPTVAANPVEVMGLTFPNPVGLAAGLDKNGDYFSALGKLGFGFIEIGTVTPRPQPGNDKPRLFRIPQKQAIVNRMGFNNKGVDHLVEQVKRYRLRRSQFQSSQFRERQYQPQIGINIGKNAATPVEHAVDDYRSAMSKAYPLADYIAVNISSPNTPGLRSLQYGEQLRQLLSALKTFQLQLEKSHSRYVPLAIKVAPDLDENEVRAVASALLTEGMDAVIATNTTLGRDTVAGLRHGDEAGGLSGAPLTERSTEVIRQLYAELGEQLPIIGVGGIMCGDDAVNKLKAGAKLVQLYSGFIYRGPKLIAEAADAIASFNRSAVGT